MGSRASILLITTDQRRRDTIGCYGAATCETPNVDALAAKGVRFTRAYTNSAVCTPVRASLLTGMSPFCHGLPANFERNVGYPWEIPAHNTLLPAVLKPPGYVCGSVGKWHVGVRGAWLALLPRAWRSAQHLALCTATRPMPMRKGHGWPDCTSIW